MWKKCRVVMLPTKEKADLFFIGDWNKLYPTHAVRSTDSKDFQDDESFQHLYITSNEEIKVGDWFIANQLPHQLKAIVEGDYPYEVINSISGEKEFHSKHWGMNKIIASTNPSLNLPKPSTEFINKYISQYNKGNIISDIMVEFEADWENIEEVSRLKVDSNNTITIKKIKDSYTRDEVVQLCWEAYTESIGRMSPASIKGIITPLFNKWIEEHL